MWMILVLIGSLLLACVGIAGYAFALTQKRPPLALYLSRRAQSNYLRLGQIPARQIELIVRQEDPNFYSHPGFDIESIRKAWQSNSREKRITLGGSTITQQLAKNLYLRFTRSYLRKLVGFLIALKLERALGKDRILEMYVNVIYFGNGVYGIAEAARFYFDKPVADLDLNQMVMLAVIPSAPTICNPIQHPEAFEHMRNRFLVRFTEGDRPLIAPAEVTAILSHGATCLDAELRKPDDFTRSYPQTIPMTNERFGSFHDEKA